MVPVYSLCTYGGAGDVGNRFLSLVTNLLYSSTLSDMATCYKLFDRRALEGLTVVSNRFDFEPEITAKVLRRGFRIYEVPISYAGREPDEGKKITWRDGFGAVRRNGPRSRDGAAPCHRGATVWFTGLPGAGKTTLAVRRTPAGSATVDPAEVR
jgi:hypothetical protein